VGAILLNAREALHRFARAGLSEEEIRDALTFAAAPLIVLRMLPGEQKGPYGAPGPIAARRAGTRYGLPMAAFHPASFPGPYERILISASGRERKGGIELAYRSFSCHLGCCATWSKDSSQMSRIAFLVTSLPIVSPAALAGSADGNGALALAALTGEHSPSLKKNDKILLGKFLNGHAHAAPASKGKITVAADAVICKASNVNITLHECELIFGAKKATVHGRKAHELYATLAELGVPPDGAAGSIFEALSNLDCTIDPAEVKQKAGGGAHCTFAPAN
jgi:hypothetical protein